MLQSSQQEENSGVKVEKLKNVERTIRSRVECEERAFRIVKKLIEDHVDGAYLVECGKLISAEHYSDIVEERAISHLCGYPVCANSLGQMPKKKYHISTKTNKVYEMSERKNFCSNQCFKASRHFAGQIPESPLWMRDKEKLPSIILLPHDRIKGIIGDEVIGSNPKELLKDDLRSLEELDKKTSASKQKYYALDIVTKVRQKAEEQDKREKEEKHIELAQLVKEQESDGSAQFVGPTSESSLKRAAPASLSPVGGCGDTAEKETLCDMLFDENVLPDLVQQLGDLQTEERVQQKNLPETNVSNSISAEMNYVLTTVTEPAVSVKTGVDTQKPHNKDFSKMDQLKALLSKRKALLSKMADVQTLKHTLPSDSVSPENHQHIKDERASRETTKERSNLTSSSNSSSSDELLASKSKETSTEEFSKPRISTAITPLVRVCDILKTWMTKDSALYLSASSNTEGLHRFSDRRIQQGYGALCHRLTAQEKAMETMLDSSLAGEATAEKFSRPTKPVPDYTALKEQTEAFTLNVMEFITGKKQESRKDQDKDTEEDSAICLPTVDTYNQCQIRVKIVLDRLDKSLPDVLAPLGLSVQDVSSPVRELVYTCSLNKDNIVMKPGEWTLAALFILKILASRYPQIETSFSGNLATRHFSAILSRLGHSLVDLQHLSQDIQHAADNLR